MPVSYTHLDVYKRQVFDYSGSFAQYSVLSRLESTIMIAALMPNYNRANIAFAYGEGAWLFDERGRKFLDFGAGIATSSLGHGHVHLTNAIAEQAAKVIHVSNLYRVPGAELMAKRLVEASFADSVFFCNSGAEANEGLVKAMRKTHADAGQPERYRVICFEGAFHGRTLAMIAATGNAKYPVSYTHLDVYKRQRKGWRIRRFWCW